MTAALAKLAHYFGPVGIASIAAWLLALAMALLFILYWRKSKVCTAALVLAIAGLGLSLINSDNVSAIRIDFSQELLAAQQRADREAAEEEQPAKPDEADALQEAKRAEAAEKAPADDELQGDYRRRGKVERDEGKTVTEKINTESTGTEDRPVQQNVRTMKMHEVEQANRFDRLNLFCARWTLYLTVLLVVVDYFRRFNKPFESYMPLPLGGRLVDSLFPKSHTVCARGDARRWKQFLLRAVRKGETFIYFCREDPSLPAAQRPSLPAALKRLPRFVPVPWRLEKVTCTNGSGDFDDEFLFESAWFGRYCFVLTGDGPPALARLNGLADFLELRRQTRASAAHTVNVLWDLDSPIPEDTLDRLLPLCRETNFRLILATAAPIPADHGPKKRPRHDSSK